jgi:phosphoribosylformimino-5-aminoimidazole carboxamide ribotide isomerase
VKIIPAIDLIEGKCVRLTKGDYDTKKVYNEDPLEVAKMFADAGISHLHLVDLDGAKAGKIINWKVLDRISSSTSLNIDFGGGLKSDDDLRIAFDCGAGQVTGGSIAVKDPETFLRWLSVYGPDRIILGADARNEKIAVSGWQEETNEFVFDFVKKYREKGITHCICTDISKDGMLEGPSLDLYKKMLDEVEGLQLIASGGVTSIHDLDSLKEAGLYGAIIGKAIYEGRMNLEEIGRWMALG